MSRTNSCGPYCPLNAMYGPEQAKKTFAWLEEQIHLLAEKKLSRFAPLDQQFAILCAAPDQVQSAGETPLQSLAGLAQRHFASHFKALELLPFFLSDPENRLALVDYDQVDPNFGSWQDIERLQDRFDLMVHLPLSHVSDQHIWFQKYLCNQAPYHRYFLSLPADTDLSMAAHPTPNPLLSQVQGVDGEKWVWTTFGSKYPDLNYGSPQLLCEMITILMSLAGRGARMIRLDDISYLWKEIGTTCQDLPQSHGIVHLFQDILLDSGSNTLLAGSVDAPFQEALSFFGGGGELHLLENSALPGLVLHAFLTESASVLRRWASGLSLPAPDVTFLNALDLPQGIPLEPTRGLLREAGVERVLAHAQAAKLLITERPDADHQELKADCLVSSFWDALQFPDEDNADHEQMKRYLAAWSLSLSLVGVPVVHLHSLFAPVLPGRVDFRSWNLKRPSISAADAESFLDAAEGPVGKVWQHIQRLLAVRASISAFHPFSAQMVLDNTDEIFSLLRIAPDGRSMVVCLFNFSAKPAQIQLDLRMLGFKNRAWRDLISGERFAFSTESECLMRGFQTLWLVPDANEG